MAQKWMVWSKNISKDLIQAANPKLFKLPDKVMAGVEVELDDDLFKTLSANPVWLARAQEAAQKEGNALIAKVAKLILQAEKKAADSPAKERAAIAKQANQLFEKMLNDAIGDVAAAVSKVYDDYKKGQADLSKATWKAVGKIALGAALTVVSVLTTVATAGGTSPLAIFGFVKTGLTTIQETAKILATQLGATDKTAALVKVDLAALKVMIGDCQKDQEKYKKKRDDLIQKALKENKKKKESELDKTVISKIDDQLSKEFKSNFKVFANSAKEVTLNVISSFIGVEIPSLKNCQGHLEVLKNSISGLERSQRKASEQIYKFMDAPKDLSKNLAEVKKRPHPNPKYVKALEESIAKMEKILEKCLVSVEKMSAQINLANDRYKEYKGALEAMEKGQAGWVGKVEAAISFTIDLASGLADSGSLFEKAISAVSTIEGTVGSIAIDEA